MVPCRVGEKTAVMRWRLGEVSVVVETFALASPVFERFGRRWKMMFQDRTIRLVYSQGLEKIAVILRQVLTYLCHEEKKP